MDYILTENEQSIKELVRDYTNKKIIPLRKTLDEKEEFPFNIFKELGKMDLFRLMVPEKYGGISESLMPLILAIEELSRGDAGIGVSFAVNAIASKGLILYGTEEQKNKYLPLIADGKIYTAFALTEPEAGSDVASIKTSATRKGNKFIINGVKRFITNAEIADIYVVIAATEPEKKHRGLSAFLIEKGSPGFTFGKKENKMGICSSVTKELFFNNCEIPKENIIGEVGKGFYIALNLLDRNRIGIGAQGLGIAQAALEESIKYAGIRKQFNKTINSFQAIQFMLADMATQIEAARLLIYYAARCAELQIQNLTKISAMAKLFATDIAMKVTTDAVQIFGGYGYMKEFPVEKLMRDAKVTQIYEGTNQIQRLTIAKELIKENS
jgi:butyryl-CoA dehydrogenase